MTKKDRVYAIVIFCLWYNRNRCCNGFVLAMGFQSPVALGGLVGGAPRNEERETVSLGRLRNDLIW